MEKLYWNTIKLNDQKLYFTVNNNGLNFISDLGHPISQIYDFYPATHFEFRNDRDVTIQYVERLTAVSHGVSRDWNLPIDVTEAGDAAMQQVWQLMMAIPYGSTRSARALAAAARVELATVVQAAQRAPLLMVIPVHRVVWPVDDPPQLRGGSWFNHQRLTMEMTNGLNDLE